MSWTILTVFSKITGSTKATSQWNCVSQAPINPGRQASRSKRKQQNWGLPSSDALNPRKHRAASRRRTPQVSPGTEAALGLRGLRHTVAHPLTLQVYLFLLRWVFVVTRRLSLVAASRAYSLVAAGGLFIEVASLLWSTGLVVPRRVGSLRTRDGAWVPGTGRRRRSHPCENTDWAHAMSREALAKRRSSHKFCLQGGSVTASDTGTGAQRSKGLRPPEQAAQRRGRLSWSWEKGPACRKETKESWPQGSLTSNPSLLAELWGQAK